MGAGDWDGGVSSIGMFDVMGPRESTQEESEGGENGQEPGHGAINIGGRGKEETEKMQPVRTEEVVEARRTKRSRKEEVTHTLLRGQVR